MTELLIKEILLLISVNIGDETMVKLHLGCGGKYLEGYMNIDYPSSKQTVQELKKVDLHADILHLNYPLESVDEIRLHHVYEHFPRAVACGLLASWNSWLRKDGILRIEVPDFQKMAFKMISPFSSINQRAVAERHIFGSQEADWAIHYEGYTISTLRHMIGLYGFDIFKTMKNNWKDTGNIEIIAKKTKSFSNHDYFDTITKEYLEMFLVSKESSTEQKLLEIWLKSYGHQIETSWGI